MVRRNPRLFAVACSILAISLGIGLWLDTGGFAGNLLAELAGVVVGTIIAVLVVERLLDQDRRARWSLVEEQTIRTLRFALTKAAMPLYMALPTPRPPNADPVTMDEAGLLGKALTNLSVALGDDLPEGFKPAPLRETLASVDPHVVFIRDSVMPRLLTVGPDHRLRRLPASRHRLPGLPRGERLGRIAAPEIQGHS
jgi:hypothetical protein